MGKDVARVVRRVQDKHWANPSSPYSLGRAAAQILEDSRVEIAAAFGVESQGTVFVSGATEAANQVVATLEAEYSEGGKRRILSSPLEHPCVLDALERAREHGMEVELLSADHSGRVLFSELRDRMDASVALVCCMLANNETGVVQEVRSVSEIVHENGARILCDCVQASGKIPVDLSILDVDYAIVSSHKINGPKGAGALFLRRGAPLRALLEGGQQESGLRAGTENLSAIAGFAAACVRIPSLLDASGKLRGLRDKFCRKLFDLRPDVEFNHVPEGLPNTISVRFPGTGNASLLGYLDAHGVQVGAGSACHTESDLPSHVLLAMGRSGIQARETLRFSLCAGGNRPTVWADMEYVLKLLEDWFGDRIRPVGIIGPDQLDEAFLARKNLWILDARHEFDRRLIPSLPGSHEISWPFTRGLGDVPRDKQVLVVCQVGVDAPILAWKLRKQGVRDVAFLAFGLAAWKLGCAHQMPGKNRRGTLLQ